MLDKFKGLSTSSKVLVVAATVAIVLMVAAVIGVVATGGFNGF